MNEATHSTTGVKQVKGGRVPLALTVGFAAGALFARKPTAALVALATGLLASSATWSKAAVRDEEPVSSSTDDVSVPLAPLPEVGPPDLGAPNTPVNQLASLSLPAIASQPFPAANGSGSLQAKPRSAQPVRVSHIPGKISIAPVPGAIEKANGEKLPFRRG